MTDPRGGVVGNTYDDSGRVITQADPLGRSTTFAYTPTETTITDPRGNVTVEGYAFGLRTGVTRGAGTPSAATSTYAYDPFTLGLTSKTDPNGHTETMVYDDNGNLVRSTDGLGRTTTSTFDALNNPTSSTDPSGVTTTMTYDARGNLSTRSTPLVAPARRRPSSSRTTTTRPLTLATSPPSPIRTATCRWRPTTTTGT